MKCFPLTAYFHPAVVRFLFSLIKTSIQSRWFFTYIILSSPLATDPILLFFAIAICWILFPVLYSLLSGPTRSSTSRLINPESCYRRLIPLYYRLILYSVCSTPRFSTIIEPVFSKILFLFYQAATGITTLARFLSIPSPIHELPPINYIWVLYFPSLLLILRFREIRQNFHFWAIPALPGFISPPSPISLSKTLTITNGSACFLVYSHFVVFHYPQVV